MVFKRPSINAQVNENVRKRYLAKIAAHFIYSSKERLIAKYSKYSNCIKTEFINLFFVGVKIIDGHGNQLPEFGDQIPVFGEKYKVWRYLITRKLSFYEHYR